MKPASDILDRISELKAKGEPFALATVVRTLSVTAAKAGAKAVICRDGSIADGWIGGGCARGAVLKAARDALADGRPRLVSVQPEAGLQEAGASAGEERGGVRYARNMCPSQGTVDVFVEPILPRPEVVIFGASPVAVALADLARRVGFFVTACAPSAEQDAFVEVDRRVDGFVHEIHDGARRLVVVSTQGRGDEAALAAALATGCDYVAFVGSARKASTLKAALRDKGADEARLSALRAPAGLDIGAVTPEEIAVSILADIVAFRRQGDVAVLRGGAP
ncbi:MAG TPA: XdhC family protein [Rhodoblastus sp.]|nr:XdhC family protein [Rhodoblastus sp.]